MTAVGWLWGLGKRRYMTGIPLTGNVKILGTIEQELGRILFKESTLFDTIVCISVSCYTTPTTRCIKIKPPF